MNKKAYKIGTDFEFIPKNTRRTRIINWIKFPKTSEINENHPILSNALIIERYIAPTTVKGSVALKIFKKRGNFELEKNFIAIKSEKINNKILATMLVNTRIIKDFFRTYWIFPFSFFALNKERYLISPSLIPKPEKILNQLTITIDRVNKPYISGPKSLAITIR